MSFANLVKKLDATGRIKLRGAQCEGWTETSGENSLRNKTVPSKGKGAEYAAKYRAEEDKAYFEMMAKSVTQGVARMDVTGGGQSQMEQPEELTSIGTVPNLRELNREELTQVYNRYKFEPVEPTEHLENIFNQKDEILKMIDTNQVCIIKGPTGCGKSTQIPQFILDKHAAEQKHCNIVVTQPRRIAAITLAQRVCRERGWGEPGGIVGYQVGLDKKLDEDTRLLYCTTGVLLEKLINAKQMNDYTHIILDEVHERDEDMDFLMLVVKRFLRMNSPHVKVLLMSATIDTTKFASYFGIYIRNKLEPTVTYTITTESKYSVQVYYIDILEKFGTIPIFNENEPGIDDETYKFVPILIRAFNNIDDTDYKCKRSNEKKGAVLIFLPGLHQIETLHEILIKEDMNQKKRTKNPDDLNLWLCPLHSSITKDEQEKVTAYAPHGMRKIILSTNIAESSLTIPDVKYVIDFCLTKHLVADPITGFTSLQMAWASHTNCIQREGRVGRVQDGRVYRMVPKPFYQFKMRKESEPEMRRCPLDIVVLKCKRLLKDECPLKLISSALDPPDLDNYEKTILKLKEIGALLMTCRGENDEKDGDLTFMGQVMGCLPLDVRITKLILLGHLFDVLDEAIIMGCAMSVRNIFSEPFQQRLEAYNNKLLWANLSESDSIAYLTTYNVWRHLTAMGKFKRSKNIENNWGKMFMLQIRHLKEVALLEEDIRKRLRHFNIGDRDPKHRSDNSHGRKPLWNAREKPLILKLALAGAFYPNYFSCNSQDLNAEIKAVKLLGGHNPYQCVYLQNSPHPAPLYLDQVKGVLQKNHISDNFELHYDSSNKLIVEFTHTKVETKEIGDKNLHLHVPGEIVMAVYRAVKLRQLNVPLDIRVFPPSIAKEKLNKMNSLAKSKSSMMTLNKQSSEYNPAIPWEQQLIEISVCHVENAGVFYVHLCPETIGKLRQVHALLNRQEKSLCDLCSEVEENVIYAAPYKDENDDNPCYYRAKVTKKQIYENQILYTVFFIDYGNSDIILARDLKEIICEEAQNQLQEIPPLAIKCVLAEVGPKLGHWSDEADDYVKKILESPDGANTWPAEVYSYVNEAASVFVFLEEEGRGGKRPLTLNDVLVKKGYAQVKEESYLSKRNHDKREEFRRGGPPKDRLESVEGSNLFSSMSKDLMALPVSEGAVKRLKGPISPLEMKLFSKTKGSLPKEVKVEWNSVNSVLLDSYPNEPYEKLLIAGHVSQSPDGYKLTLNHTTVLPNLDGLAALVCLLFAPTVELRSDEFRSRYIGALCGLGSDPGSGGPYFPENDMEITFDKEITNDDLILVNKIRHFMNLRFCSPHSEDMQLNEVVLYQKKIKELLTTLLKATRPPVKVEHCQNKHRWNLVNENYLLVPFQGKISDESLLNSIYNLFSAIDLDPKGDYIYILELVKKVQNLMECVHKDLLPKELKCDLCDLDFSYRTQLRQHVLCTHHKQLVQWLKGRASVHGLTLDTSPKPAIDQPSDTNQSMGRPSNSRQPMGKSTGNQSMSRPSTSNQPKGKPSNSNQSVGRLSTSNQPLGKPSNNHSMGRPSISNQPVGRPSTSNQPKGRPPTINMFKPSMNF